MSTRTEVRVVFGKKIKFHIEKADPCCICLDEKPTLYLNCRCVRKKPLVCAKCLKFLNKFSKCPICRSKYDKSNTRPFKIENLYEEKGDIEMKQDILNSTLVFNISELKCGISMNKCIDKGANIYYKDGEAILNAVRFGDAGIIYSLVNRIDYYSIISLEFHKKILEESNKNRGSNRVRIQEMLYSIDLDRW